MLNRPERRPDIVGKIGSAWRFAAPVLHHTPDESGNLGQWLVHLERPYYDVDGMPVDGYLVAVMHLRPIPGELRPPKPRVKGVTHEIDVCCLHPGKPAPDVDGRAEGVRASIVTPVELTEQFGGLNDEHVPRMAEGVIRAVVEGKVRIDREDRDTWRHALNMAITLVRGQHPTVYRTEIVDDLATGDTSLAWGEKGTTLFGPDGKGRIS